MVEQRRKLVHEKDAVFESPNSTSEDAFPAGARSGSTTSVPASQPIFWCVGQPGKPATRQILHHRAFLYRPQQPEYGAHSRAAEANPQGCSRRQMMRWS